MAGGAAAALTGLIFVAVSLHLEQVMGSVIHRDRAWASIVLLLSQLLVALAVLAPGQPLRVLGIELAVLALFWLARSVRVAKQLGDAIRQAARPHARAWQLEWLVWILWVAALVGAAIGLVAENGSIGFPLLATAMVGMFGFAIWNAWLLLAEVTE